MQQSMRYEALYLFFVGLVTLAVAGPVVDQWGLGTNGVHNNPVFKFKPEIRWSFDGNKTAAAFGGIIPLNFDEKTLFISNGQGGANPSIWKMTWDGEIVKQFNIEDLSHAFSGTVSVRNGVIYIYNDGYSKFYAIDEASQTVLWSTSRIDDTEFSTGPIVWSQDETYFAFATWLNIVALNASNGAILWTYPIDYQFNGVPIIYSKIDDSLVWLTNSQELIKLDMKTGTEIWRNSDLKYVSEVNQPLSVAIDDDGNIYGAAPVYYRVYKVAKNGTLIWWSDAIQSLPAYSSTILAGEWLFIIDNSQGAVYSIVAENGTTFVGYLNDDPNFGTYNKWITGQLFWNQNVLYGSFQGVIAAYNTTDPLNIVPLWAIETGVGDSNLGGIAIAADGTMFLPSTMYSNDWPFLVAVGCPLGLHLKPDGTACVQCYAGEVLNANTQKCDKCPEGTFSYDGDEQCTACATDPNNPQCPPPPVSVPATNEPVADSPVDVPVAVEAPSASSPSTLSTPVKSPVIQVNSASKLVGAASLVASLFLIII